VVLAESFVEGHRAHLGQVSTGLDAAGSSEQADPPFPRKMAVEIARVIPVLWLQGSLGLELLRQERLDEDQ
jgi:hypothetical protein